ncbi:septum formation initiator family protein [Candidatus Sumerlaeota bacterium]|nr:septum formation initiator family protein [Candidatus Sumerlaeota bacterium]
MPKRTSPRPAQRTATKPRALHPLARALSIVIQLRLLRTVSLIAVCLALWAAWNLERIHDLTEARTQRDQLRGQVEQVESDIASMRQQRQALLTNPRAIERAAREQFKMTHPGEVLVQIDRGENPD